MGWGRVFWILAAVDVALLTVGLIAMRLVEGRF